MAHITLANTNKIIFNSDIKGLDLSGDVYKIPIHFFSKYEVNALLAIQELLKDPETYFKEIYAPYRPIDTYSYVYEGQSPSHHLSPECPRLHARYENFEIPKEIKEKGADTVIEFRKWFETVKHLLASPDIFVVRLQTRWGIVTNPNAISHENSGTIEFEDYNIEDLEKNIDSKIKEAGRFYYRTEKNKTILHLFSKFTFLAYRKEAIENNNTKYSDTEIKELLSKYDEEYKRPLKRMLIEYYRLKHNPEIKMEGSLLEELGFKPCGHCYSENSDTQTPPIHVPNRKTKSYDDDLPF